MASLRHTLFNTGCELLYHSGVLGAAPRLVPQNLTVLLYHRVNYPENPDFKMLKPNVSATPAQFEAQLDYLGRHYSVVSLAQVHAWVVSGRPLPPRAVLITFDDGYADNYQHALPALRRRGFPAVIFLPTDYVGGARPFYWDYVAYCFKTTKRSSAELPHLGTCVWQDAAGLERITLQWIEAIKQLPEIEKRKLVEALPDLLDVVVPAHAFAQEYLTWEQVHEMLAAGIDFGGHTASHPILTRLPLADAEREILTGKQVLEKALGQRVVSFAYPNGQASDFSEEIVQLVERAGFEIAFTLLPGPASFAKVRQQPLTVRRLAVASSDTLPRFAMRLTGVSRYLHW